jgi:hypothetical protein
MAFPANHQQNEQQQQKEMTFPLNIINKTADCCIYTLYLQRFVKYHFLTKLIIL